MEKTIVKIDGSRDLRFSGTVLAKTSSTNERAMGGIYSGDCGSWTVLRLHQTARGKFVCERIHRTIWQGDRDRFDGKVCETIEEVQQFFGYGDLAKELYAEADIDAAEDIA